MMASPPVAITQGVEELTKGYERNFELCLHKLGIKWRVNLERVPKALEVYCNDEIYKIEMVHKRIAQWSKAEMQDARDQFDEAVADWF